MALNKLGDFIEQVDIRNEGNIFGVESLRGISINKVLIPTKADTSNLNLKPYKIVRHNWFTYCTVTSRNGNKISLAYNDGDDCIVSSINPVFKVKDENKLLSRYLMMYFNRSEFDRCARFNSWGSVRETFSWEDFCDIELEVPSIEIQKKYVAIYEGLLANLRSYEKGLDDLKLVCDGYIEELRRNYKPEKLYNYIEQYKTINKDLKVQKLAGLIGGKIKEARKSSGQDNLSKFQVVYPNTIVYPPPHFGEVGTIGIVEDVPVLLSPMYVSFKAKDETNVNMHYVLLWCYRSEFKRYASFASCDSIRDTFDFEKLSEYAIPVPPKKIQDSIVSVYIEMEKRKTYLDALKQQIMSICPVLIRGSILDAQGGENA